MAITTLSFASDPSWNVPGPEFPMSLFGQPARWQWSIPVSKGTSTTLRAAVPSWTGRPPDAEYWKNAVTKLEWPAVADIWQAVARTVLMNDPFFRPFREAWYVTRDGTWTEQFKQHATFRALAQELAIRMDEELASVSRLLKSIEVAAPRGVASASAGSELSDADPIRNAPEPGEINATIGFPSWARVVDWGWKGAKIGTLFSLQGVGWIVAEHVAVYGYHRFQEHQARERARERAERRQQRNFQLNAIELPFQASGTDEVRGFEQSGFDLPLWAIRSPEAKDFDWTGMIGAPRVLVSQDGVFV